MVNSWIALRLPAPWLPHSSPTHSFQRPHTSTNSHPLFTDCMHVTLNQILVQVHFHVALGSSHWSGSQEELFGNSRLFLHLELFLLLSWGFHHCIRFSPFIFLLSRFFLSACLVEYLNFFRPVTSFFRDCTDFWNQGYVVFIGDNVSFILVGDEAELVRF